MNIGSHNSLSYIRPKKWWMRPFHFMARCQDIDFVDQYILGARVFDLRISFDRKHFGKVQVRHGAMEFDVPTSLLNLFYYYLNSAGDCYLRVILEFNKEPKDIEYQEQKFKTYCEQLENKYKHIKFFGGNRKYDWNVVYQFMNEDIPTLVDRYSSTTSLFKSDNKFLRIIDDLYPKLYAKLRNKKNFKEFDEGPNDYLFVDFVEIR